MKTYYLFPNKFKKIGMFLLIPSAVLGISTLVYEYDLSFLDFNLPAIFIDGIYSNSGNALFGIVNNNILDEILGVLIIISSLFVAFSKEKAEDEYIAKIRLESLVWAVYVNYGILLLSMLFVFEFSFFYVMIFNMFTVLLFFMVRFNWQISKLKKVANYEE